MALGNAQCTESTCPGGRVRVGLGNRQNDPKSSVLLGMIAMIMYCLPSKSKVFQNIQVLLFVSIQINKLMRNVVFCELADWLTGW